MAALAGAAALVAAYAVTPAFTLEMDRPMTGILTGFYDTERAGQETFAWTRRQAAMQLPGLDRRGGWTCTVRLRGGRAADIALPEAVFAVDGIVAVRHQTTNEPADVRVPLAPRSGTGAVITLTTATFVPGGGDTRELGVYVDRWACAPDEGFVPLPPVPAITTAAIAAGAFGAVIGLMGAPALVAGAGVAAVAGLQTMPLVHDLGPFSAFAVPIEWVAVGLALVMWAALLVSRRALGRAISGAGQIALFVTCLFLYLKLVAVFHPSKFIVDAVFHAHRVEWVLEGRYFFTQLMPSGVRFPYAIGLYVFTAPWTLFTSDIVSLLRLVVSSAEAIGGLLLYRLIVRSWGDRAVAATATTLYALVPRVFEIVGNANMTNAFGQSAALVVLVAATLWPLGRGRWKNWVGLTLLIAFALLCHISTFVLLSAILGLLAVMYWLLGRPSLRGEAWAIAAAFAAAAVLSVVLYYGHFGEAFRSTARVTDTSAATTAATPAPPAPTLAAKARGAATFSVASVGWPLVFLAIPGIVALKRRGWRDRLGLAIATLSLTFGLVTAAVVVMPVGQAFDRYAIEFISRVTLATYPALVIFAALGAVWAWRAGGLLRVAGAAAVAWSLVIAADVWMGWLR